MFLRGRENMWIIIYFTVASLINVILSTLKSVITVKGGKVIASVANAIAYGFNTIVIKSITNIDLWVAVCVSVVCNLIGVYIALTITGKMEKERLWKITITVPTESLKDLKSDLKANEIPFIAYETSYEKYKVIDIFSKDKIESRKVRNLVNKYNVKYTISANAGTL